MSDNNQFAYNVKLRFTWSHIFTFTALIASAYFVFVGTTYLSRSNLLVGGIAAGVFVVLAAICFVGPQHLKGTEERFRRRIKWERALLLAGILVLAAGMYPMSHVWGVVADQDRINNNFRRAIDGSRYMFDEYEEYAAMRRDNVLNDMTVAAENPRSGAAGYKAYGLDRSIAVHQVSTAGDLVDLNLLHKGEPELKAAALEWIEGADQGVSPWNVFLLGNTDKIRDALYTWDNSLVEMSNHVTADEKVQDTPAPFSSERAATAAAGIQDIEDNITGYAGWTINATWFMAVLWLMFMFPYALQKRTIKSAYRLFGKAPDKVGGFDGYSWSGNSNASGNNNATGPAPRGNKYSGTF